VVNATPVLANRKVWELTFHGMWCNVSVNCVGAGFTTIFSVATGFN